MACNAQVPSSAAAVRAHDAMLAAGIKGHARLYNALVKAFAYEAERAADTQSMLRGAPGRGGGPAANMLSSTWDPRQVGPYGIAWYCCISTMCVQDVSHTVS